MKLRLISKINFFRVLVCGVLTLTLGFQTLSQAFKSSFDFDYAVEWNDTSDANEVDSDIEEKEQKKELKQYHFTGIMLDCIASNYTSYKLKKQAVVNIDINLPPPQEFNV